MLLDEPTAGMTHEDVERISALIGRVAQNRTVLMVEHNLSVVADLCHYITVLAARRDPRRRRLRDGVAQSRSDRGLPGKGACLTRGAPTTAARGERPARLVRRVARPARRRLRSAPRRSGDAARPQRRGQDDDAQVDHGHGRAARGLDRLRRRRDDRLPSNRIARLGIAFCPEERGIFASLTVLENLLLPPEVRAGRLRPRAHLRAVSEPAGARASQGTQALGRRAADARDRAHPAHGRARCCCSTSRPKGSRR